MSEYDDDRTVFEDGFVSRAPEPPTPESVSLTERIEAEISRAREVVKRVPETDYPLTAAWLGYQDGLRFALARIKESPDV